MFNCARLHECFTLLKKAPEKNIKVVLKMALDSYNIFSMIYGKCEDSRMFFEIFHAFYVHLFMMSTNVAMTLHLQM